MANIIDKIHTTGYWRIIVRPTIFKKDRISSLTQCKEILSDSVVSYRRWSYPYFNNSSVTNGLDYIEQSCEFGHHVEYWRFYQSAQFVHHFACSEDYYVNDKYLESLDIGEPSPSGKYLSILSTLYSITEIFQFVSRLCKKNIFETLVDISIGLYGMEGRKLFFNQRSYDLSRSWISSIPEIVFDKSYDNNLIISSAAELAMEATIFVFERFNWAHQSKIIYQEEQRKLLERRL